MYAARCITTDNCWHAQEISNWQWRKYVDKNVENSNEQLKNGKEKLLKTNVFAFFLDLGAWAPLAEGTRNKSRQLIHLCLLQQQNEHILWWIIKRVLLGPIQNSRILFLFFVPVSRCGDNILV